jgi:hypothetical protein
MSGQFVVTQTGLNDSVAAAQPGGLSIKLPTFRLGSGTGYTPTKSDTALHGSVLYTGLISGWTRMGDGSFLISCIVPADAGPFTFGEIGIYNDSGHLFALACLPDLVTKTSSLNSGFGATYTYNGLLKLGSAATTIEVTGVSPLGYPVQYVTTWDALEPAPLIGPQLYMTIISEVDNKGDLSTLVRNGTNGKWSIQSNFRAVRPLATIDAVAVNKSYLTIPLSQWLLLCPGDNTFTKGAATSFVVQAPNGYFCSAVGSLAGSNIQFTFSTLFTKGDIAVGQPLRLFTNYALT